MKVSSDLLARDLQSVLGSENVTGDPQIRSRHAVDGRQPALVCFPEEPAQVAAALKVCSEAGAIVAPWGGGSATQIGNLTQEIDVVIVLTRLTRLIEHDAANLTVTAEAGMRLAALQELLAGRRQFLAFDTPYPERSTVGGAVAINLNGPRRISYGSVRDLVIGMKVALLTGEQIKAGGKVVKNVAGYDMCKLFVGSLGTLGVITEVTLRVAPLPETAATLVASGTLPQGLRFVSDLRRSVLLPAAIVVLNSRVNDPAGPWKMAVWCEGFQESVERHLRDLTVMIKKVGLNSHILRDGAHRRLWTEACDLPLEANRTIFRATVPLTAVPKLLETIEASGERETSPHVVADLCAGSIWISLEATAGGARWFSTWTALAREHHGHMVMLAAAPAEKEGIDAWGPPPRTLALMREIKRQFDPKGLLNPGRFLGGI
ncbi:MAG: FAD-binding oxidoreductase [Candidatus Binatia bacterium]